MERLLLGRLVASVMFFVSLPAVSGQEYTGIRINELLARGTDDANPPGEWVELFNGAKQKRNLSGCRLKQGDKEYVIENLSVEPSGVAVVQPSFRLRGRGGDLVLLARDGEGVISSLDPEYPPQFTGVSYGIGAGGERVFFDQPTPGGENGKGYPGVCAEPVPNHERGFYEKPFIVTFEASVPGALVRYTLDGSTPSMNHGKTYGEGIPVYKTTTLRATTLREGYIDSRVVTHTYLFLEQVIAQPARPSRFPNQWGRSRTGHKIPGDYEMDPRVTKRTQPGYGMRESLLDLPTVSVVLPVEDLFGAKTGIYAHTERRGPTWERAMSMEWIDPEGGDGFQVNAGIRMQGNSSRRPERMQKHSFRVDFQSQYGVKKLRFPVFPDSPVRAFNKLVLRTPSTDSWALTGWMEDRYRPNDSQYVRDVWMKESLRAMGHPSGRSRYVHLYLNGLYWGIYILAERLDEDFFASHLGGVPEDWDIIRDFSEVLAGDTKSWRQLGRQAQLASDPAVYESFIGEASPLHLRNFADYMLLHFFADAEDWPHHNYYAAAHRGGDQPFRFLVWDQEIILDNHAMNRMGDTRPGPGGFFHGFMQQPAFRDLFADRVHHHLSPGGALSLRACQDRYREITAIVDKAIVAESARWGDTADKTPYGMDLPLPHDAADRDAPFYPAPVDRRAPLMTREASWLVERDNVLTNYLPSLFDLKQSHAFLNKLRANRLYPSIDPPEIVANGGSVLDVPTTIELRPKTPGSEIYYTLDGSDPRERASPGETVSLVSETAAKRLVVPKDASFDRVRPNWRELAFDDSKWQLGTGGAGYEMSRAGAYVMHIDPRLDVRRQVSSRGNESIYLRAVFNVEDPSALDRLVLRMKVDDGYIAYINGREVARFNAPTSTPRWNSAASGRREDTAAMAFERLDISSARQWLRPGKNVLAVHAMNDDRSSSDFLIHPVLEGAKRRASEVAKASNGIRYTKPIEIPSSATLRAVAKRGGEWSALAEASFYTTVPGASGNVLVSEVMYHPEGDDDAEFVEVQNVSDADAINLTGMQFAAGIEFTFPELGPLLPGHCLVVVKDMGSFRSAYGDGPVVLGEYDGGLSNSKDTIILRAAGGKVIEEIAYADELPWSLEADGQGRSLERRLGDPKALGASKEVASWSDSQSLGGSPGWGRFRRVSLKGRE